MRSTFDGLFIAKSGVQNARYNLNVTGQNITNVNSTGYTRQRVRQSPVPPSGLGMLYSPGKVLVGEGVSTDGIEQLRNPFLDCQFRTQNALCEDTSTTLTALKDIENTLNETKSEGLNAAFHDLIEQLEGLTASGKSTANEDNVKEAASLLATKFNTAAKQLSTIRSQQTDYLNKYGVDKVNDLLSNISDLSDEIKSAELAGSPALELNDKRNALIDELSQYISINVEVTDIHVASNKTLTNLSIYLADDRGKTMTVPDTDASGNPITRNVTLVDGNQRGSLSFSQGTDGRVAVSITDAEKDSSGNNFTDTDAGGINANGLFESGSIRSYISLLNDNGAYSNTDAKGIGYYENMLDTLAQKLAEVMNKDNSTNDAGDNKPLFTSTSGGTADITADNIRIAADWETGYLVTSKEAPNPGDNTNASYSNITKMISDLSSEDYTLTTGSTNLFTGTLQEAIGNVSTTLGQEIHSLANQNANYEQTLNDIDTRRDSLSSVDINEEAINLITYNQALGASSRFLTTIDECLNTIINKMGIVGRG